MASQYREQVWPEIERTRMLITELKDWVGRLAIALSDVSANTNQRHTKSTVAVSTLAVERQIHNEEHNIRQLSSIPGGNL